MWKSLKVVGTYACRCRFLARLVPRQQQKRFYKARMSEEEAPAAKRPCTESGNGQLASATCMSAREPRADGGAEKEEEGGGGAQVRLTRSSSSGSVPKRVPLASKRV